jgi:hypothetical protein
MNHFGQLAEDSTFRRQWEIYHDELDVSQTGLQADHHYLLTGYELCTLCDIRNRRYVRSSLYVNK